MSTDSEIDSDERESDPLPKFLSLAHAPRLSNRHALPLPGQISLSTTVAPGMVS